jgi:hypothetical protein
LCRETADLIVPIRFPKSRPTGGSLSGEFGQQ